ncbi:hypothetical protein EPA93_24615 [Ktedonosporobacter rubrisoli]|uniref:Uncharacterized protein n=1 Tax=Ktedonosporobacter rubrisoli TaxID=2509675 RepID=A0A4P6JU59_KTERU|nr:hypothetical protein [Ktedonosporobacter rubrisoli]QBD78994.1 hypothetical protein EPA93_24615 [Ktedonosporobacter rubrisoli]
MIDKRNVFDEEVFTYRLTKDNKVFLFWYNKHVKTLKGPEAQKFLRQIAGAEKTEQQLIMAKLTGNFKRGNER